MKNQFKFMNPVIGLIASAIKVGARPIGPTKIFYKKRVLSDKAQSIKQGDAACKRRRKNIKRARDAVRCARNYQALTIPQPPFDYFGEGYCIKP